MSCRHALYDILYCIIINLETISFPNRFTGKGLANNAYNMHAGSKKHLIAPFSYIRLSLTMETSNV